MNNDRHLFNWKLLQLAEEDEFERDPRCGGVWRFDYGIIYCPRCDNHGEKMTQIDHDLLVAHRVFTIRAACRER